jgi:DNA-binding MarR family transcriptional regulator
MPARTQQDAALELLVRFTRLVMTTMSRDYLQAIDDLGLSFSQVKAMHHLSIEITEPTLKQLGDELGLSLPAVSRAVEGLVKRGLVTRTEDSADRRSKRIAATPHGRKLVGELTALRVASLEKLTESLEPAERQALEDALRPLVERAEERAAE